MSDWDAVVQPLQVGDDTVAITAVSMGNPHAVQVVADVDAAPVREQGAAIERHERFPARVNAGFLQVVDAHEVRLRSSVVRARPWACGWARAQRWSRASCAVCWERGWLQTRGGELEIAWDGPGTPVRIDRAGSDGFRGRDGACLKELA